MALAVPATLLIAGCDGGGVGSPGEVTVGETRALDDAAEMLEHQRLSDDDEGRPVSATDGNPGTETAT